MNTRPRSLTGALACASLITLLAACNLTPQPPTDAPPTATVFSSLPLLKPTLPTSTALASSAAPTTVPALATPTQQASTGGGQAQPAATSAPQAVSLPTPCKIGSALEVYLVIEGQRRHIVDMLTFDNLGYKPADIKDCGASASLPEGERITRLFKGSGDPVYLVDLGKRRHIPDMKTFTALGYTPGDITLLPDNVIALWPLGVPMEAAAAVSIATAVYVYPRGVYTIQQWRPIEGPVMFDFATISAPNQPDIQVDGVEGIATLAATDVTGEGHDDVVFLRRGVGSAHCCWGTTVYDLGPTPVKVIDIRSTAYYSQSTGRGEFIDLDGDFSFEFITVDPLTSGISCSQPSVTAIARYDAGSQQYVAASAQFASYYDAEIAQLTASTQPGGVCEIYPLVVTLYYAGKNDEAKATFDRLYTGENAETEWGRLEAGVRQGRFYVAPR